MSGGDTRQEEGNVIAVATSAISAFAKGANSTFAEAAAFTINHGAGHNAGLNEAGDKNGYDDQGNYFKPLGNIFVPQTPNVMTNDNNLISGQGLQKFITSPTNQQPANPSENTLSIKQAYIHRFGNNTPHANLPTE